MIWIRNIPPAPQRGPLLAGRRKCRSHRAEPSRAAPPPSRAAPLSSRRGAAPGRPPPERGPRPRTRFRRGRPDRAPRVPAPRLGVSRLGGAARAEQRAPLAGDFFWGVAVVGAAVALINFKSPLKKLSLFLGPVQESFQVCSLKVSLIAVTFFFFFFTTSCPRFPPSLAPEGRRRRVVFLAARCSLPERLSGAGCVCGPARAEQSRSGSRFAAGYLEGIRLICARRLLLNRTKMEKLGLT